MHSACLSSNDPHVAFISMFNQFGTVGLKLSGRFTWWDWWLEKSAGMFEFSVPHVQAAELGSVSYQRDAILALAEIIDILKEDMHVIYIERCLQVALILFKGEHDDNVMHAALYLLATILRAGPSEPCFGRMFVKGGGAKLLLRFLALPNAPRNEALDIILATDLGGSELGTIKDAVIKESSQSLADLYGDDPPYAVEGNTVIRQEDLSETYQDIHHRMPDFRTSKSLGKYLIQVPLWFSMNEMTNFQVAGSDLVCMPIVKDVKTACS
jgi:hypothetical protein